MVGQAPPQAFHLPCSGFQLVADNSPVRPVLGVWHLGVVKVLFLGCGLFLLEEGYQPTRPLMEYWHHGRQGLSSSAVSAAAASAGGLRSLAPATGAICPSLSFADHLFV